MLVFDGWYPPCEHPEILLTYFISKSTINLKYYQDWDRENAKPKFSFLGGIRLRR